ncbi:MAG TPA: tyrosine-type recombinase/integrase [Thermoleophilia bacterium]|nr:tyrosine-type recombinase/integrase [Thermoleophilia bacterium]
MLVRECWQADKSFWAWSDKEWIVVLGGHSLAFRDRNNPRVSQSVRIEIAAVAYLHGWFRNVLALGQFKRIALAQRVFGRVALETARKQVVEPLGQWGYAAGTALLSALCEALLRNESPLLEHLSAEVLDRVRRDSAPSKRSLYFQIGKALAARRLLDEPLSIAHSPRDIVRDDLSVGVAAEWSQWIERWMRTSTLESRDHLRLHLYKAGRWLGVHHVDVVSAAQWTRELCAEYVAAATRMRVGDFTVRNVRLPRAGQPLSARTIAAELAAMRTFFSDCQEWGWICRRFDPGRSLALPRSIKARIGRKPRVIADDVWARLLWAGLHLDEADLPRAGRCGAQGHAWPLEYVHALVRVWLFAGLRSDEISRLRVGCVRWQDANGRAGDKAVCVLDVPTTKTSTEFTKPVDPSVGQAIEAWEAVRPSQPKHTDRKTGEQVDLLFTYRARPMRRELINHSVIPMLCRKAGVPRRDVRGTITSHRARATIASQLFNSREPMSLFELQAWLGHNSPASTQHYVAITPTRLAQAYTDAGYFERNVRAIEVLIDQDTMKQAVADGDPWRYYDLGHGLCAYEFFDQCAHRMACARCDFYRPSQSSLARLLCAKDNILRFVQQIPLTDEERAVVDGDLAAIERLTKKLADRPTPSGQTPAQLHHCPGPTACSRGLTGDST